MHNEQVFTPEHIVTQMLNKVGYVPSNNISNKHIIDNSCGDGAFLAEIVERYILHGVLKNKTHKEIRHGLETYVHGIEIDSALCGKTVCRLNAVAKKHGIYGVNWDILNADTVTVYRKPRYAMKMDFVVGNPPYCKIHDVPQELRETYKAVCSNAVGTFDSYVMFFWIGISILKGTGKLIYITPSTWTNSLYARGLREWFLDKSAIVSITDFGHHRVFDDATTFCMITEVGGLNEAKTVKVVDPIGGRIVNDAPLSDYCVGDDKRFFFKDARTLELLREIGRAGYDEMFDVKNGFATLKDKLFVVKSEDVSKFNSDYVIPCCKASKCEMQGIVYPYDKDCRPITVLEDLGENVQVLLKERADQMRINTNMIGWHLYGRTQALNSVWKRKFAVANLIRETSDVKLMYLDEGTGVYSGFYITSKDNFEDERTKAFIENTLKSDAFVSYVHSLGRYKNGGFSTFTAKELKDYLNTMRGRCNF